MGCATPPRRRQTLPPEIAVPPALVRRTRRLLAALLLGTAAFAGLGLAMAGALRAEATLAGANALFLVLLLLGGVVVPIDRLPGPLASLAGLLPLAPLSELLRIALGAPGGGDPLGPALVLGAWAAGAILVAMRSFRWE